jgi:hypothetical protein
MEQGILDAAVRAATIKSNLARLSAKTLDDIIAATPSEVRAAIDTIQAGANGIQAQLMDDLYEAETILRNAALESKDKIQGDGGLYGVTVSFVAATAKWDEKKLADLASSLAETHPEIVAKLFACRKAGEPTTRIAYKELK